MEALQRSIRTSLLFCEWKWLHQTPLDFCFYQRFVLRYQLQTEKRITVYHWGPNRSLLIHTQLFLNYLLQRDKLFKIAFSFLVVESFVPVFSCFLQFHWHAVQLSFKKAFLEMTFFFFSVPASFFQLDENHYKFIWRSFAHLKWMQFFTTHLNIHLKKCKWLL